MSATGSNTPANHFGGSFGPNEWLVDEMFEKYLADSNSVDAAWGEFFADYKPGANGTSTGATGATGVAAIFFGSGGVPPFGALSSVGIIAPVEVPFAPGL